MSVAQYYNSAGMYRHPQAMSAAVAVAAHQGAQFYQNRPIHSWYASSYHGQANQMSQPATTYCMQEEQQLATAWHTNSAHSFQQEFQDYFGHYQGQQHNNQQHHHPHQHQANPSCVNDNVALPSPPITVSGSELSSPGGLDGSSPNHHSNNNNARPSQVRSPYEWIKKNSYQSQPLPGKLNVKAIIFVVFV